MLPKVEQQQPNPPSSDISVLVKELSVDGKGEIEWCSVNNIIELIEAMPDIQFFAGQEEIRNGCVRCKICFDYLCNQDNSLKKSDPLVNEDNGHIAKAHIKKVAKLFLRHTTIYYPVYIMSYLYVLDMETTYQLAYF